MVAIDAHPFVTPRVRSYLERELHLNEAKRAKWLQHWLDFRYARSVEDLLSRDERAGRFCYGDEPTMADICLFAHLTSAKMLYGCDLDPYPTVKRIYEACEQVEAFALAHPHRQLMLRRCPKGGARTSEWSRSRQVPPSPVAPLTERVWFDAGRLNIGCHAVA